MHQLYAGFRCHVRQDVACTFDFHQYQYNEKGRSQSIICEPIELYLHTAMPFFLSPGYSRYSFTCHGRTSSPNRPDLSRRLANIRSHSSQARLRCSLSTEGTCLSHSQILSNTLAFVLTVKHNHDIEIVPYREECQSQNMSLWFVILILYKGLLMVSRASSTHPRVTSLVLVLRLVPLVENTPCHHPGPERFTLHRSECLHRLYLFNTWLVSYIHSIRANTIYLLSHIVFYRCMYDGHCVSRLRAQSKRAFHRSTGTADFAAHLDHRSAS